MKCPFCSTLNTNVKDSRASEDNSAIRRRRVCEKCHARFTTFERIHLRELYVIKQNNTLKPFDRDKLTNSICIALRKRPIDSDQIETLVNSIVYKLENLRLTRISSQLIGRIVMEKLKKIDKVAYIRFASVYMNFEDIEDFNEIVEKLMK